MAAPVFVADEVVTAAKMNSLPKGVLGYAEVTANQSGISIIADLTGLSVTVDVAASRRIKVTGHHKISQATSTGRVVGSVRESTTVLGQTGEHTLLANEAAFFDGSVIITPSAGSHTYKLSLSTTAGTVTMEAAATNPAFIVVEDIGGV